MTPKQIDVRHLPSALPSAPTRATMLRTTEDLPMAHFADNAGRSNGRGGRAKELTFRHHAGAANCQ